MVNPPSEDNLPGEDEVLYRSQVQDVLIPYTTKEDTYNYYETRNYVNNVNQQHTQVLQTYDDQLQKRETYVYGNGRATYTNESTGDSYHYLTSQSGSVTGLTQNGQAVASSSYALYGATKQTTDTTGNPFAYNGEARDITGLDYLRARYYDNQAGTFLTADSYSGSQTDPLSQNLYAYVQNNPANYTDPSGHIRSPHLMLDDRFGGKVYDSPRPLINTDDGTLYAPSTPEHKAHQIRQQQTGNYSYVYTPKVYSNTPIIKPTSYAQAQAQRDRAREQALAEQRRQQNIRNEYSRATGSKGKAKLREAQNLFKNWGKALEETLKHVCNPQTTKGKDSGTRNKPTISVADFRKIEEANKYGLTVAEKAKIDKMSMSDLKSQYSSVIGNYNTYVGTGYFNPLGIGENRAVIERYKVLKAEEEAKAAAQAAELAKYQAWNIYDTIRATGLKPDGSKPSKAELDIANSGWYPWLKGMTQGAQLVSSISSAYVGYQSYYGKPILGVDTNYIQTAKAKINEKLFNFDDIDSGFKAIDTDTLPVKTYSERFQNSTGNRIAEEFVADLTSNQTNRSLVKSYENDGGMSVAEIDFETLGLEKVQSIQTQYGTGRRGNLPDGTNVILRPGSSSKEGVYLSQPTIEFQTRKIGGVNYKIRYLE
ncbi:Cell wall-associated polypeptide CWBP200 [Streptococcus suis]|uniref:Cell wall-associated polypeptide CWBP200 n=1 Tax=Streptococcus suis TaxID=1307 RepID=A0AAN2UT69_STRSU|nr:RHS repeat-associated core domain-containing protein [Streptococcus suis]CYU92861.1 Cell wall-associated polypeptide CWBP200 [Streptococcus suis]